MIFVGAVCMTESDNKITLTDLKSKVKEFNSARNWEQFHTPKEVAVSISIEAAELLEIFQWKSLSTSDVKFDDKIILQIKEELADIMIYIMSLSNTLNIDLSEVVLFKLSKNAEKYPIISQKN